MPPSAESQTSSSAIGSSAGMPSWGSSSGPTTTAPMRWAMRRKPTRVQLTPTSSSTSREPGTSIAAAAWNAIEDGSPGTWMSSTSSSSCGCTVTVAPSRSTRAPACCSIRSVWSRVGAGSVTLVAPEASSPANSTHDLICADATGSSYSIPSSRAPAIVSGVKRPSRASSRAPIRRSGSAMRSTGRRRIDSSPSRIQTPSDCPASQPGSSRSSVPALPTSITPVGCAAARRPGPRISSSPSRRSTIAPSACTAASVESVSAASR